jgi:hypothetical protein
MLTDRETDRLDEAKQSLFTKILRPHLTTYKLQSHLKVNDLVNYGRSEQIYEKQYK